MVLGHLLRIGISCNVNIVPKNGYFRFGVSPNTAKMPVNGYKMGNTTKRWLRFKFEEVYYV